MKKKINQIIKNTVKIKTIITNKIKQIQSYLFIFHLFNFCNFCKFCPPYFTECSCFFLIFFQNVFKISNFLAFVPKYGPPLKHSLLVSINEVYYDSWMTVTVLEREFGRHSRCIRWCRWQGPAPGCSSGSRRLWAPHPSAGGLTPGQSSYAETVRSPAPSERPQTQAPGLNAFYSSAQTTPTHQLIIVTL